MIITRTPFRMSFFGGGTDMPEFFNEHGGSVISTTFDKYCYVTARHLPRFFDYSTELVYSRIERVSDPSELEHPAVRNAMQMLDMREMRISYEADLPARSGLGTSSSFAVGMLNAFHCMKGTYASKDRLAREAIRLERELCAEAGGWQGSDRRGVRRPQPHRLRRRRLLGPAGRHLARAQARAQLQPDDVLHRLHPLLLGHAENQPRLG